MNYIVPASVLAPIITSSVNFRFLNKAFKLLFFYLITSLVVNITTAVLSYHHIPNLIFFHLYTPVEAIFLFLFFQPLIADHRILKITRLLLVAFPLYCIFNFIFLQDRTVFNTYTHPVEAILFIALCLYFFWEQSARQDTEVRWGDTPSNWIISGYLLYFSSTFFLYLFSNVLITNYGREANLFIWNIHGGIILITNLLLTIAFYKCRK
jgi:hypothetical protein